MLEALFSELETAMYETDGQPQSDFVILYIAKLKRITKDTFEKTLFALMDAMRKSTIFIIDSVSYFGKYR